METPRRKADVAMIGAVVAIMFQFGGLVWGAATLTSAVNELREVTRRLEVADARRGDVLQDLSARVRVLETQRAADDRQTAEILRLLRDMGAR